MILPYVTSGGVAEGLTQRGFNDFFRINNPEGYSKAMVGVWSLATTQMNEEFNDLMQGVSDAAMLPCTVQFTNEAAQGFAALFKQMHGHSPDYLGQFGYVQTQLLLIGVIEALTVTYLLSSLKELSGIVLFLIVLLVLPSGCPA